eukprot:GHVU01120091.1.p1 GENE.GHVU01120091.1~~GHVU01120091.1.p1  ORF type:complete len:108 (-),score=17.12 GHVU01120091.1:362-685(-)
MHGNKSCQSSEEHRGAQACVGLSSTPSFQMTVASSSNGGRVDGTFVAIDAAVPPPAAGRSSSLRHSFLEETTSSCPPSYRHKGEPNHPELAPRGGVVAEHYCRLCWI